MIKPNSLRDAVLLANPDLPTDPAHLSLYIDAGEIRSKLGQTTGFRYHYTLNLIVLDYSKHPDCIVAPLLAWVVRNQPDLLQDPEKGKISFEVNFNTDSTYDLAIKMPLSESVILSKKDGQTVATHKPEPTVPGMEEYMGDWDLYIKGVATAWPIQDPEALPLP